jgi:hypothetical protein
MPAREAMPVHTDVLAWLHVVWGVFGLLTAAALGVLAAGTGAALVELGSMDRTGKAAMGVLVVCGAALALFGATMALVGRGLLRRRRAGRVAALALAVPNLVLVPFGTALGLYTFWVLLNDDARREFGRPPRSRRTPQITSMEGA